MRINKYIFFVLVSAFLFLLPSSTKAQEDYTINSFNSNITLNQDTSLTVEEVIEVNFPYPKHGIFRNIPIVYSARGKTIKPKFELLDVSDGFENQVDSTLSKSSGFATIKIGDPDVTVVGPQKYVIKYNISRVVIPYETHDEIYWNITGSNWDTDIVESSSTVKSDFAKISKVDCFAGYVGEATKDCEAMFTDSEASFVSLNPLGYGRDFTVVIALDKNNQLQFPSVLQNAVYTATDNWGYFIAVLPLLFFLIVWFKKGRDIRYISENPYYTPKDKTTKTKPLFSHSHLPLVYAPIDGLTPAEVGTIVDERVDIRDVVAEIAELGRLGFLKIKKTETKRLIGSTTDYVFTKAQKNSEKLADYQKYLLEKLFEGGDSTKLSSLKNKFYKHLEEFRNKLYQNLANGKIFDGRVDQIKSKWVAVFIGIEISATYFLITYANSVSNFYPFALFVILSVPALIFAASMPRRTPEGYSLYRQIKGLHFYLSKGKWREEIAEKHLFFEEMLPLAISLGIVNKLATDMAELGVESPKYFSGTSAGLLASDLSNFSNSAGATLMSAPSGSGGSWSGGSGFSGGGSSGGGFGGGGGGR